MTTNRPARNASTTQMTAVNCRPPSATILVVKSLSLLVVVAAVASSAGPDHQARHPLHRGGG